MFVFTNTLEISFMFVIEQNEYCIYKYLQIKCSLKMSRLSNVWYFDDAESRRNASHDYKSHKIPYKSDIY